MPPTRRATVAHRGDLDICELMELMCGPAPPLGVPDAEPISEWRTDDERRDAWNRHKDRDPLATQRRRERERGDVLWAEAEYGS